MRPLLAILFLVFSHVPAKALELATGEFPPMTGEALQSGGVVNHVVARMAQEAGVEPVFTYLPWKRALEATRAGRFEASSYWGLKPEHDVDFIRVGPVIHTRVVMFHLDGTTLPEVSDLSEFSGLRIGGTIGYTYSSAFDRLVQAGTLDVDWSSEDIDNLRKLLGGRLDAFPMTELAGWDLISRSFTAEEQDQFKTSAGAIRETAGYVLVSRAAPDAEGLAARLQSALDSLWASGEIDRIYATYLGQTQHERAGLGRRPHPYR